MLADSHTKVSKIIKTQIGYYLINGDRISKVWIFKRFGNTNNIGVPNMNRWSMNTGISWCYYRWLNCIPMWIRSHANHHISPFMTIKANRTKWIYILATNRIEYIYLLDISILTLIERSRPIYAFDICPEHRNVYVFRNMTYVKTRLQ